jgi:hypothetical protein
LSLSIRYNLLVILHTPEIEIKDGQASLSARVEMAKPVPGFPERLWFTFPGQYGVYLSESGNPFAAGLLLTAMYFGENMELRAPLSPRLLYGLNEYQQVMHAWFPKTFKIIDIHPASFEPENPQLSAGKVGTAFSGGVDSLYNLWANRPQNREVPSVKLTHGLFIHGFDIRLYEQEDYDETSRKYAALLERQGIELIAARTNGFLFWEFRVDWNYVHGGLLLGTALCLEKLFSIFYVPSTHVYNDLKPLSTSPYLDHLLSTERMRVIHFGSQITRIGKLKILSEWPEAYDNLRVCTEIGKRRGVSNCSQCNKCLRTMFMLEILGSLERFTTFRHGFRYRDLLYWIFFSRSSQTYPRMLSKAARQAGRWDIALPALLGVPIGYLNMWIYYSILKFIPPKVYYRWKRRFFGRFAEER